LSAFYFVIRKDSLYCDRKNSDKRNNCIVVLNIILESLLKWFAPILSFTAEEIYTLINKEKKSIHLESFIEIPKKFRNDKLNDKWIELKKIRDICNISIESKRASKEIGSSLEANLIINLNNKIYEITKGVDFSELCITSAAKIERNNSENIVVQTVKAEGEKCPICWKINKKKCERHSV